MNTFFSMGRAALCTISPIFLIIFLILFSAGAQAQTTHVITVGDSFFSPANLTIQAGDTVRWVNGAGGINHNVTASDGSFASTTSSQFTFERTFNEPGQYGYYCTIHGTPNSGMRGVITVEGGGGGGPAFDLSMSEVSVDSGPTYSPGDSVPIGAEVENLGSEASPAYTVKFYASTDITITSGDILLGSSNRNALGAGNDANFNVNLDLPQGIEGGNYFIGAIIDIDDTNNGNNSNADDEPIIVTGTIGPGFLINNGLNDAWFNPATAGQGFFITVFPDIGAIFLAWFTYDTERPDETVTAILGEAGHRWLTAFGNYEGNIANLNVELTEGGVFDSAEPMTTQDPNYGTIELEFIDCSNAIVRYSIPSLGLMGEIPITRIALDNVPRCLALQPQ